MFWPDWLFPMRRKYPEVTTNQPPYGRKGFSCSPLLPHLFSLIRNAAADTTHRQTETTRWHALHLRFWNSMPFQACTRQRGIAVVDINNIDLQPAVSSFPTNALTSKKYWGLSRGQCKTADRYERKVAIVTKQQGPFLYSFGTTVLLSLHILLWIRSHIQFSSKRAPPSSLRSILLSTRKQKRMYLF